MADILSTIALARAAGSEQGQRKADTSHKEAIAEPSAQNTASRCCHQGAQYENTTAASSSSISETKKTSGFLKLLPSRLPDEDLQAISSSPKLHTYQPNILETESLLTAYIQHMAREMASEKRLEIVVMSTTSAHHYISKKEEHLIARLDDLTGEAIYTDSLK